MSPPRMYMLSTRLMESFHCCHGPPPPPDPPPYPPRPLPRAKYGLIARLTRPVEKALACTPFQPGREVGRLEGEKDAVRKEARRARKGEEGRAERAVDVEKEGVKSPVVCMERAGVKKRAGREGRRAGESEGKKKGSGAGLGVVEGRRERSRVFWKAVRGISDEST